MSNRGVRFDNYFGRIMLHSILHATKDTLLVLPAILLVYIIIELFEQKVGFFKNGKFLKTKGAPLYGAVAGIIPQCGISVMASKLYEKRLIKVGTLFAVFIATSDEAIILLLSSGKFFATGMLVVLKFVFAIIIGFAINFLVPKLSTVEKDEIFEHSEVCAHHSHSHSHEGEHNDNFFEKYLWVPLKHSLTTILFIFIVNVVFELTFHFIGEDKVLDFMSGTKFYQPFVVGLIGLIPNCASSVLVTQLYIAGGITFGSMLAGLITNAGIGLALLFKDGTKLKRNLIIVISLYIIGVILGLLVVAISTI